MGLGTCRNILYVTQQSRQHGRLQFTDFVNNQNSKPRNKYLDQLVPSFSYFTSRLVRCGGRGVSQQGNPSTRGNWFGPAKVPHAFHLQTEQTSSFILAPTLSLPLVKTRDQNICSACLESNILRLTEFFFNQKTCLDHFDHFGSRAYFFLSILGP